MKSRVSKRLVETVREVFAEELVYKMSQQAQLRDEANSITGSTIDAALRRTAARMKSAEIGRAIRDLKSALGTLESIANEQNAKARARRAVARHAKKTEGKQLPLFELN